jgi:hypothetical protein
MGIGEVNLFFKISKNGISKFQKILVQITSILSQDILLLITW